MEYEFKIGDTVKIHVNSQYYNENTVVNPRDTLGEIVKIDNDDDHYKHTIEVKWYNNEENSYISIDLELITEYKPLTTVDELLQKLKEVNSK